MLISEDYRKQQAELHKNPNYGMASVMYAPIVTALIDRLEINELLDYGAGKGRLGQSIKPHRRVLIDHYEPANPEMPEWAETPEPRELVACIDVLEHIEPELIDHVLDDLQRCVLQVGFFTIHTGPAVKTLPDGRNAHLIQQHPEWWLQKLWQRFELVQYTEVNNGFYVVVRPTDGNRQLRKSEASSGAVHAPD